MNAIPKLEELGISPAPWKVATNGYGSEDVVDKDGELIVAYEPDFEKPHDSACKRLIAAAPDLYDCLREAVGEMCHDCPRNNHDSREECDQCFVQRWREALAKAAGGAE